jgi:hypothetical protein
VKAGRPILIVVLTGALIVAGSITYRNWLRLLSSVKQKQTSLSRQGQLVSVPPFVTKEPDRYQALRIITSIDNAGSQMTPSVTRVSIARDGEKRREDYGSDGDAVLETSYLETPAGAFVLYPAKKLYADINPAAPGSALPDHGTDEEAEFSAERLGNETSGLALYEKLGSESLDGRLTAKYRITSGGPANGTQPSSVTLIWIDEALGMAIRSETETVDRSHHAKVTVELRDIKVQVDPGLFEMPKEYKKVEYQELREGLTRTRAGSSNGSGKL